MTIRDPSRVLNAVILALVERLRAVVLETFDPTICMLRTGEFAFRDADHEKAEKAAQEKVEKACEHYDKVKEGGHTPKEIGAAGKECLKAWKEWEGILAKP